MNPALRLLAADDKAMVVDGVDVDGGGVTEGTGVNERKGVDEHEGDL